MQDTLEKKITQNKENYRLKEEHDFYTLKSRNGDLTTIQIKKASIVDKLKKEYFYRYDIDTETSVYIHIVNNMVDIVNKELLVDRFMRYIETLSDFEHKIIHRDKDGTETKIPFKVTSELIRVSLMENIGEYFSKNLLNRLTPDMPILFHKDTKTSKHLYFKDNFIEVDANGYEVRDYSELSGFIWSNQRLSRNFKFVQEPGNFEKFIENVCNNDADRIKALKTVIGYLIHGYFDTKLYAVIFTDERFSDSDEPCGRTGKTLLCKAIGHIMNANKLSTVYTEINGKNFVPNDKHRYGDCNADTSLVCINDLSRNIPFETFFNDITENITVDKKNEKPFRIQSKLIISTNRTIKIYGDSAIDRSCVFEFSDYYNKDRSPFQEYKQWFFTDDWTPDEWNRFDSFMVKCIIEYFQNGLIKPKLINFHRRTLIEHTSQEFVEWMDDIVKNRIIKSSDDITPDVAFKPGDEIQKKDLYISFTGTYQDYKQLKQKTFTKWLKQYSRESKEIQEIKKELGTEGRSNNKDYIKIIYK